MLQISDFLKSERERLGLTQEEIASKCGVSKRTYIYYEQGERVPNTDFLAGTNIAMDSGYILVDDHHETNIKGVYASGDVVKKEIYQIVNAASEGAEAVVYMTR